MQNSLMRYAYQALESALVSNLSNVESIFLIPHHSLPLTLKHPCPTLAYRECSVLQLKAAFPVCFIIFPREVAGDAPFSSAILTLCA